MFPTRYFADRFFAPRYWAKVGASAGGTDGVQVLQGFLANISALMNR